MLTTSIPTAVRKLQHRHLGAIAALILISLLSSVSGLSLHHQITNGWDGFLWGVADPVLHLDSLARILGIGLISTGIVHGSFITMSFVLASILGILTHLSTFHLPGAEIAIAIFTIGFGAMLVMPYRPNWLVVVILGAIAGLLQGYVSGQAINGIDIISLLTYTLGFGLTQYAIATSTRRLVSDSLSTIVRFVGFAFIAIGFVFCGNFINFLGAGNF
ncbi:HupE/UreJ family protein [Anabaena sp. FACHB-709]|uniref:Hydrogenase accessory protein HupE n=2 Tax=Nostocaceae TaxID=1162 RepID=A0A1Z4KN05_ANAVA|nr:MULTISPECIES: HupE/UreJ family protein [Nostocaceae]BAY70328.1 hydrogenase accessory protein HupE [Trichormus variabilis NIES-23]HBW30718.1 hydantoin utilization protein [Nostoc sp. UBA8866]MBD2173499.1 HupE/UreJ family protein [Anabaena cylindrica FACHB-318]MBD2265192.1 HupE/UreJ family protein [Anabaena sp. FACHB-709]MBD2274560.1 HupE/UreJ family protein [Nostoc sp. PCC 7120 = FACHB-418]